MGSTWKMVLAVVIGTICPLAAQAGWGFGVSVGVPVYPRPYYGYPYYYYPPYPYYAAPPPVVIAAPPVVQALPAPAPAYATPVADAGSQVAPTTATRGGEAERFLAQLNDADPQARASAAVQLGRMRVQRAIDPLIRVLGTDRNPTVREAAARGLGLIGSPGGLGALQRAAQADDDREVRHSAQFAAEGIRAALRGK